MMCLLRAMEATYRDRGKVTEVDGVLWMGCALSGAKERYAKTAADGAVDLFELGERMLPEPINR